VVGFHVVMRGDFIRLGAVLLALLVLGCDGGGSGAGDGAPEGPTPDGSAGETTAPATVDFVVQGCTERTATRCSGPVPLRLTFTALLQGPASSPSWDMGDATTPNCGAAGDPTCHVVTHTYGTPGTYDVTLTVVDATGTTSAHKIGFVVAQQASAGAVCDADGDCASGTCECKPGVGCLPPLDEGVCLEACELSCQDKGSTCVDLSLSEGEPWRTHLCLPGCSASSDCTRPGFACNLAPSVKGWRNVCVPSALRFIGEPCLTADGAPEAAACVGGQCVDIGASGYCSWACKAGACPDGTRCAKLEPTGSSMCLLRCGPGADCKGDPLLACELPGAGAQGYAILGAQEPPGTRFCAPKRCKADQDCGLVGTCQAGFCQRQ